jgi:DEP domain-containing protein 5
MHEIEMLGLLDHDVLSSIELPFLSPPKSSSIDRSIASTTSSTATLPATTIAPTDPASTPRPLHASGSHTSVTTMGISETSTVPRLSKAEADKFDMVVFSCRPATPPFSTHNTPALSHVHITQRSTGSLSSGGGSFRSDGGSRAESVVGLKRSLSSRTTESRFATIQESPNSSAVDLPSTSRLNRLTGTKDSPGSGDTTDSRDAERLVAGTSSSVARPAHLLSTSPSQSSIMSSRTVRSNSSSLSAATSTTRVGSLRGKAGAARSITPTGARTRGASTTGITGATAAGQISPTASTSPTASLSPNTRPVPKSVGSTSRFAPSWLWNAFVRSGPNPSETAIVSGVAGSMTPRAASGGAMVNTLEPEKAGQGSAQNLGSRDMQKNSLQPFAQRAPKPVAIKSAATVGRSGLGSGLVRTTTDEDGLVTPHSRSLTRQSPLTRYSPLSQTPPADIPFITGHGKRRGTLSSILAPLSVPLGSSASSPPPAHTNPTNPRASAPQPHATLSLAHRWAHLFPLPLSKHDIKWRSMVTPGCLPLTTEHFPRLAELEERWIVSPYDFVIDPPEMRSFLVRPPTVPAASVSNPEVVRRAWALAVMRAMVALRLAQGFQFVLAPSAPSSMQSPVQQGGESGVASLRRTSSHATAHLSSGSAASDGPKARGAAEVLRTSTEPVYLSMSNEIHRIAYSGDSIQVRRYEKRERRVVKEYEYQCLIWPKLGVGYTELRTTFKGAVFEGYGWNR